MATRRRQAVRHGYVVIDKPAGWTSHDVVARVRRLVGERRVGHAGTLDPAAVGVLPVAVGLATRTVEYLAEASKAYRAWVTFGVTTDSADRDGRVTSTCDPSNLDLHVIGGALDAFTGVIAQRPPMHSAIRVGGKRLYELARVGTEIDVEPRIVTIHEARIVDWTSPVLCLDVACSKGTYIRSLARDLGDAVGTGAHLSHLVRTRSEPFGIADAVTLEELERQLGESAWDQVAFHPDWVLRHLTAIVLGSQQAIDWGHGKPVSLDTLAGVTPTMRAYDACGRWLGVGGYDAATGSVKPVKVIPMESPTVVTHNPSWSLPHVSGGEHVVSIGTFDGVHLGHRYLLERAAARAAELGLPFLVVTFEPNPAQIIRPEQFRGRLNTPQQKLERLWAAGAGDVMVVPFTEELMRVSPEAFLNELMAACHPVEVWVGEEFALGRNRSGDVARLTEIGASMGFRLEAVARRECDGEVVSSSRIRQYLLDAAPEKAEQLLGYPYRISGEVIRGAQIGRTIGFPTANVVPPPLLVQVPDGIYATLATVGYGSDALGAMTYIGTRPALNTGERLIETNILDFTGDLYGQTLHCDFLKRLRPDATFDSLEALVAQLKRDEMDARSVLDRYHRR